MPLVATFRTLAPCGEKHTVVLLTTARPYSRDGRPVCVLNGRAYGPGELPEGVLVTRSRDFRAVEALRRAGFRLEAPDASPRGATPNAADKADWGGFW
jgi:hypothetical protein